MNDEDRRPSLNDRSADRIRNAQRDRDGLAPPDANGASGPEANATMRQVWSNPGGEAHNYRNATVGAGTKGDDHSELTAAETPETTKHLSDATLKPEDRDATAEAIAMAGKIRSGS